MAVWRLCFSLMCAIWRLMDRGVAILETEWEGSGRIITIQTLKIITITYLLPFHLAKQLKNLFSAKIISFPLETSVLSPILPLLFGPCRPQHSTLPYLRSHFWVAASPSLPLILLSSFISISYRWINIFFNRATLSFHDMFLQTRMNTITNRWLHNLKSLWTLGNNTSSRVNVWAITITIFGNWKWKLSPNNSSQITNKQSNTENCNYKNEENKNSHCQFAFLLVLMQEK